MIGLSIGIVVMAYFLGAVPFGLLMARWQRGIDIRQYGSGSTGATNVLRTMGWRASAAVFVCDLLKTCVPVLLAQVITGSAWVEAAAGVAALVGHSWPIYTNWTGGRGVTSSLGAVLVIQPLVAIGALIVAGTVMALTRFVSLGSLAGVSFGAIVLSILIVDGSLPVGAIVFVIGATVVVFVRHRDNILRLIAGKERKIGQKAEKIQKKAAT